MGKHEFAVIGLGRFGRNVAKTLEQNGHHVLGIDENEELVQEIAPFLTQAVILDSTNMEALKAVDIMSFDTVIVAIGTDFEANIMTTVSLKELGVKRVICKAPTVQQEKILLRVGADEVVMPERESAVRLAETLHTPGMLEQFKLGADTDYTVAEFTVPPGLCNQSMGQANIRGRLGINVLVIKRGEDVIVNPGADVILKAGDVLVMLGHADEIEEFSALK